MTPRRFRSPRDVGSAFLSLDQMELLEHVESPLGDWCRRVLSVERGKLLDDLGIDNVLPRGVLDPDVPEEDGVLVAALVNEDGNVWSPALGWHAPESPVDVDEGTIALTEADTAFVARAMMEGADAVVFRAPLPLALVAADVVRDVEGDDVEVLADVPEGASTVAIVDGLDRNAVLELLAVLPGPVVYRRHDGQWVEDAEWVKVMRSITPPPMLSLEGDQLASVTKQVDAATVGQDFEKFKASDRSRYMTASSYIADLEQETTSVLVESNLSLVAVAGRELSPSDIKNTEQLRRYWLYGKGAAKIRWGTPGAWRRCYRNVVKHMGPKMAPGYCTNLSKRLGGPGVATHVGSKR